MSLPIEWVEKIFRKLALAYGRDFLARWEGVDLNDVKTDWAHELAGFESAPECIAYALANLPMSRAPNVYEFRDVCRSAPRKEVAQIAYTPNPDRMIAELKKLRPMLATQKCDVDLKDWARRLKARHESGEKLHKCQIDAYREALRLPGVVGRVM